MYELALFAGAGGGLLATKWLLGWEAVCYVENAPKVVEMLKARIRDGLLDDAPIWDDVRTFDGRPWRGCVDIITAGFPCQPFSQAGKRRGADDERNMWPDTIRVIREVRPRYVLLENVPALLSSGYYGEILGDLAASGYDAPWDCIPASAVGANHQRDRLFIVAHSQQPSDRCEKLSRQAERKDATRPTSRVGGSGAGSRAEDVAHAQSERCGKAGQFRHSQSAQRAACGGEAVADADSNGGRAYVERLFVTLDRNGQLAGSKAADANNAGCPIKGTVGRESQHADVEPSSDQWGWWQVEPDMGRVVDGMARRVDRLKALGNGQVPAVVACVWRLLGEVEK